jgi:thiol:disulfide interchange protein DsbC
MRIDFTPIFVENVARLTGAAAIALGLTIPCGFADDSRGARESMSSVASALGVASQDVYPSPVSGVFLVRHGHEFGYASSDGRYLLRGELFDLTTGRDLTEDARRADRLDAIQTFGDVNTIEFAVPTSAPKKAIVTVFTDVDCGYCRRFHSQIRDYNARGITVRYLAWPRSGPGSESWRRAEGVWCAKDRAAALTAAKLGQAVPPGSCDSQVGREYKLGVELGVHGTPTLILPDGELLAGYLSPEDLAAKLDATTASPGDPRSR